MDLFCKKLPKIELHAHLNGSLSKTTLKKLGCSEDSLSNFQSPSTTLKEVFSQFSIAHNAINSKESLYIATKDIIQEFSDDGVVYLELRTTPRSEELMSQEEYIETVIKAITDSESSKIIVKLLLSLNRTCSLEDQEKTLDVVLKFAEEYPEVIRGVDFSGDPSRGEFCRYLFEKARGSGLNIVIHCAEQKNDVEVKEILDFKPDRIGHGTSIHPKYQGTEEIWQNYKNRPIPLEICLTSNVVCCTSKSYEEHHVKEWIKEGLPFCLGTDDKGVFNTDLSNEYFHLYKAFQFSREELWKISMNAVSYSFASDDEKEFLKLALCQWKNKNIA